MDLISWAFAVAQEELAHTLPHRWAHVQGVESRARQASDLFNGDDRQILISAAILHDVGYSPRLAVTGFHPLDGARHLATLAAPERLCALVAHHSCAYREAELRGLNSELAVWVDEESSLRDALWWADMSTTPDGEPTNVHDRIEEIEKRYGPEDLVTFFIRQAKSELVAAVERTEDRLRRLG
ncbi:metal-dependent phosphohydrolase, HD subdomain protein [Lentzea sp. NBRC 105346]|uniref:HD domain-containing protein n=1 Tax=Lentzea sp. NBRC 105346 TaxID=3032205 RepID=UPI0024A2C96E|nr:HD domain-containing protein [Lentzea sp. NBRC 105346]GLZ31411.1 metal-dependent phosphohydrolase, HD subdomain protein [Lentzea sp. NBRC 105346]